MGSGELRQGECAYCDWKLGQDDDKVPSVMNNRSQDPMKYVYTSDNLEDNELWPRWSELWDIAGTMGSICHLAEQTWWKVAVNI